MQVTAKFELASCRPLLCNQDISKEATEIREDPPELPHRSILESCKEGEDVEEKLLLETIKRNNAKLLAIYET